MGSNFNAMRVEDIPPGCEWQGEKVQIFRQFGGEGPSEGNVCQREWKFVFG